MRFAVLDQNSLLVKKKIFNNDDNKIVTKAAGRAIGAECMKYKEMLLNKKNVKTETGAYSILYIQNLQNDTLFHTMMYMFPCFIMIG